MPAPLVEPSYNLTGANTGTAGGRLVPPVLTSLSAVTTGTGAVLDCGTIVTNPVMALSAPGTPGAGAVILEGSLDNVNWYPVATTTTVPDTTAVITTATKPARFLRARVTTTVTSTTATALISAAP